MAKLLTADQVRARLRKACEEAGGQVAWAKGEGRPSPQYVHDVLCGYREPGPVISAALGLRSRRVWEIVTEGLAGVRKDA